MAFSVKLIDKSDEVKEELAQAIETALEEVGLAAEAYAKAECRVDTGRLRNSITHALDGQPAAIRSYRASYGSNRRKDGKRYSASSKNAGSVGVGFYSGTAPAEAGTRRAVYIGTNVEYAPHVETRVKSFLRPAVIEHISEYKGIVERRLRGE